MSDGALDFAQHLKKRIVEEMKTAYGARAFERWLHMKHMGTLQEPDGYACLRSPCGDAMEIYIKFDKGRVKEAAFQTEGCGSNAVCGSFAAELAMGKLPEEVMEVSGETILEVLGGLPREEEHCALLAGRALKEALNDYLKKRQGE